MFSYKRILTYAREGLAESGAWLDFAAFLQHALQARESQYQEDQGPLIQWLQLPGLCCQAAGGDPSWADDIAASWLLFSIAAHVLDNIQDHDPPEGWWVSLGPGAAINAATGLIFSGYSCLSRLHSLDLPHERIVEVEKDFHRTALAISSGQHLDITRKEIGLEEFWEIAGGKSGAFYAVPCRSGARLAMEDEDAIEGYGAFGHHLGLLVQVFDDLEAVQSPDCFKNPQQRAGLLRSLPVVYALSVFPAKEREKLRAMLHDEATEYDYPAFRGMVEQSGAVIYLATEIARHRAGAEEALRDANPEKQAREDLFALLASYQRKPHRS